MNSIKNISAKKITTTIFQLCFGCMAFFLFTGLTTSDVIYWSNDYRLTWDDFAGQPHFEKLDVSAITSSGIIHYEGCENDMLTCKVQAYFEKKESWVKDEAKTEYHLAHEQIHFDITELHTRKLRKALVDRQFKCEEKESFEAFVTAYIENWKNDQQTYDLLTHHSVDRKVQRAWYYKINMELSLLEDYAEEKEVITAFVEAVTEVPKKE